MRCVIRLVGQSIINTLDADEGAKEDREEEDSSPKKVELSAGRYDLRPHTSSTRHCPLSIGTVLPTRVIDIESGIWDDTLRKTPWLVL